MATSNLTGDLRLSTRYDDSLYIRPGGTGIINSGYTTNHDILVSRLSPEHSVATYIAPTINTDYLYRHQISDYGFYNHNTTYYTLDISCGYPVFDGYIIFPQNVRIEMLNKPSDDFLKEIAFTHKAEWKDRNI